MMNSIETTSWRTFPLVDVFEMSNTKSIVQKDIIPDSGTTPYVTASEKNNGVLTYISCPPEWLDKGGCIMIGGKTLTFTYQEQDFCSNDSHNIALYVKGEKQVSERVHLFLIAALRASLRQKYSWSDSISMKRIVDDEMLLPATSDGKPDWDYMDSYMQAVMDESRSDLHTLDLLKGEKRKCDTSAWGEFKVGDLFDLKRPAARSKSKYTEGDTPFIASGNINNGVVCYCEPKTDEVPDAGNCISISPLDGAAFYQPRDFLGRGGAGSAILLLYNEHLNDRIGLFIAAIIRATLTHYSYSDQINSKSIVKEHIKLPVTPDGNPDWDYMDSYMQDVMDASKEALSHLVSVEVR